MYLIVYIKLKYIQIIEKTIILHKVNYIKQKPIMIKIIDNSFEIS